MISIDAPTMRTYLYEMKNSFGLANVILGHPCFSHKFKAYTSKPKAKMMIADEKSAFSQWQETSIHHEKRSPSEERDEKAVQQQDYYDHPWSMTAATTNGRHQLPPSPIRPTHSFEGYASPFHPMATARNSNPVTTLAPLPPPPPPYECLEGINYFPSPSTIDNYYALEEPYGEHAPYISHLVYCYDPQLVSSNWHQNRHPYHHPTLWQRPTQEGEKPSPSIKVGSPLRQPRFETDEQTSPTATTVEPAMMPLATNLSAGKRKKATSSSTPSDIRKSSKRRKVSPTHELTGHESPTAQELKDPLTVRSRRAVLTWYQRYNDLVDYKNEYGDTNVPQKYEPNHSLGVWVNKQRMEMKAKLEGRRTNMTDRRVDLLQAIGFEWAKPKGQAAWEEKFEELVKYKKQHGNCHVPTKHRNNRPLGRWVSTQRHMYKDYLEGRKPKSLEHKEMKRRIDKLEAIGFAWSMLNVSSDESNDSGE